MTILSEPGFTAMSELILDTFTFFEALSANIRVLAYTHGQQGHLLKAFNAAVAA